MTGLRPPCARLAHVTRPSVGLLFLLLLAAPLSAQDLDPRAYAHVPVNGTFLVTGFSVSHGAVVRYGANFSTFSFGWQTACVAVPQSAR